VVPEEERSDGKHRRLYEENLVYNIMLATSYYVKDLLEENPDLDDDDIYDFVDENYQDIIDEALEEFHKKEGEASTAEAEEGDTGEEEGPEGAEDPESEDRGPN
jgi:hypothetical protein